jgi:N-acetylglucosamine-6-phosphate deacetylase
MASAAATVVRAATVLTPEGPVSPGAVRIEDGRISAVAPHAGPVDHHLLVPGFVELQCNGIGPIDVASASDEDWDALDGAVLSQGITTWCPTVITAPRPRLEASLGGVARARARPAGRRPSIAGAHLEGPFLAVPGAHPRQHIEDVVDDEWLTALGDTVAVATLAPELPGAIRAIESLAQTGVLVALGHSACSLEEAGRAADAGARLVTHLGNAVGSFRPRQPGLLGAALTDDRLAVSLIADLVHVHPAFLRLAFRAKGRAGTVLVTDAVATGGGAVPQEPPRLADGTLVGSVLTMDKAVANAVKGAGVALTDALSAASTTPAALLGLDDRGAISPARRADLVALDAELRVATVWIAGERVWPPP